jgi:hypothetical protein
MSEKLFLSWSATPLNILQRCQRQCVKFLSEVGDSIKFVLAMLVTAIKSIKWQCSGLNYHLLEFFDLVPLLPNHTGLICAKTLGLNISSLGPLELKYRSKAK